MIIKRNIRPIIELKYRQIVPEYALVKPAFREVIARAVQKDSPLWLADDKTEDDNGKLSHTKRQSADTGHHWGVCGLFILCKKNALWGLNLQLHALVAELHYHDGTALQAGADGCCAVGSS